MQIYYSNHISWQLFEETIYIIDETTCKIYSLKDVAKDIWLLIKKNNSVIEITKVLSDKYNVSKDILINDINEFTDSLIQENLLIKGGSCSE